MPEEMSPFGENSIQQKVNNAQMADSQQNNSNDPNANEDQQLAHIISDLDRRLRVLEERYSNLRKKIQLTDQNLIESEKSFGKELRTFNDDIMKMKRNVADFDEKITIFASEMDGTAKKTDLKIVEKYLAMWSPKMFVTRNELKEYLKNNKVALLNKDE